MDLVEAVDWYNNEGSAQSYWGLPDTVRQEVREYRSHKRAPRPPPSSPILEEEVDQADDEQDGENDDLASVLDELAVEGEADTETSVEPLPESAEKDDDDKPPPKRQQSEKQKRYADYLKIARHTLKTEHPQRKTISHSECHARCKELLREDGWIE